MKVADEIERRFLTRSSEWQKWRDERSKLFIAQAYPDSLQTNGVFGRIRSSLLPTGVTMYERGDKKPADGLKTLEKEWLMNQSDFTELMQEAGQQNLRKWRWPILWEGLEFAVDQFTHIRNNRTDLVITEIEFLSEAGAHAFTPPSWVGEEITGDHRWSNFSLCMQGEPAH